MEQFLQAVSSFSYDDLETVKILYSQLPEPNSIMLDGKFLIHHAFERFANNPELIETLVRAGASVNAKDKDGKTVLHYLADQKKDNNTSDDQLAMLTTLLFLGADIEITDKYGKKAADYSTNDSITEQLRDPKIVSLEEFEKMLKGTKM